MTCSVTLIEPKNKFHSRIYQFYACADVEVNDGQRSWKIPSYIDPHKLRELIYSSFKKYLPLNFLLRILKTHRNDVYCADAIILNQAK